MHRSGKILFTTLVAATLLAVLAAFVGCGASSSGYITSTNTTNTTASRSNPLIGKAELDFTAKSLSGDTIVLSSLQGKPVLLNFWATWCPPCRGEMPIIQQIQDEYASQGLQILEVNDAESAQNVANFISENHYTFMVLLDSNGRIGQQYGVRYIPTSYFIDKDGIIRDVVVGAFPDKAALIGHLDEIMR